MLRLKDSHGVIQERGRGPVNEFGQGSEKRFIYLLFKQKKKKGGKKKAERAFHAIERGPEPGLSNRADPVLEEWDEKGIFLPKNVWLARAGFRVHGREAGPTLALATGPGSVSSQRRSKGPELGCLGVLSPPFVLQRER